jgi:FtsP/CotA-like multicopper oxidase with cupredoxin domain
MRSTDLSVTETNVSAGAPMTAAQAHLRRTDFAEETPGMNAHEMHQGRTVTVKLEARETDWQVDAGVTIAGYGFNGQVPGPTIEASAGDTLVIRLTNALPEPTTIHWHGLRVPANMDGTEMAQHPIQPGGMFEYRFMVPDAGTFWYHPHMNETEQLEKGLYGALIVRGNDEPRLDAEKVLVLDDLKLDRQGNLASFGGWKQRHEGRLGEVRLVNGSAEPELIMAAGQVERWRIVNASSSRYVRLSIGGRPFTILGTDGGLLQAPVTVAEVLLTPGDRVDLAVGPFSAGDVIAVDCLPYDRGMVKEDAARYATVRVDAAAPSAAEIPPKLRSIERLVTTNVAPNRTVHLQGRPSLRRGISWRIDGSEHHHAEPVHVGDLQVWDVVNETKMDHPFHLHGFFFQVLQVNGTPPPFLSWEDTVNVPTKGTIRIAWLPDDRPGAWMYHCHILEHHAAGMMAHFDVLPAGATEPTASPTEHAHGHHT